MVEVQVDQQVEVLEGQMQVEVFITEKLMRLDLPKVQDQQLWVRENRFKLGNILTQ